MRAQKNAGLRTVVLRWLCFLLLLQGFPFAAGASDESDSASLLPIHRVERQAPTEKASGTPRATPSSVITSSAIAPASIPRRSIAKNGIAPEITALATSLGNSPARIFRFVHDEVDFDPKWGAGKSALGTLLEREGTSWDQAWLLQQLLTAAGVDARLEWGEIEIPADMLANITGVEDPWRAGDLMTTGGTPTVLVVEGSQVLSARFSHVWVKAHLSYIPHRGVTPGTPDTWVRMDPSLKRFTIENGLRLDNDVPFVLGDYLLSGTEQSPREIYEQALQAEIDANYPAVTSLDEVQTRKTVLQENFPFVPGSLRGKILSVAGESPDLPTAFQQHLQVEVREADGAVLLTHETPWPTVYGQRLELAWPGATAADQSTLEIFGGVFGTAPFDVDLRPSIRVDGAEVAAGAAIGSAEDVVVLVTLTSPGGQVTAVPFDLFAGEHSVLNVDFGRVPQETVDRLNQERLNATDPMEEEAWALALAGARYLRDLGGDLDRLAAFRWQRALPLGTVVLAVQRGAVSLATNGSPSTFSQGPVALDLGAMPLGLFPAQGENAPAPVATATLELLGSQGSFREAEALTVAFAGDHVSGVTFLTRAVREGQALTRVDPANLDDALAAADLGSDAEASIRAGVEAGQIAWIPEAQLLIDTFDTAAYILENPATGEAGYFVTFERLLEALNATLEILAPADGAVVTAPTEIVGTVEGETIASWTLSYRRLPDGTPMALAADSGSVVNAPLAELDPTLLLNGLYEIILTGRTETGQTGSVRSTVSVEGQMKIGHLRLEFLDLNVDVAGLPLQVSRIYDSRDRSPGDFGHGWTLGTSRVSVFESKTPGLGWRGEVRGPGLPAYCIEPEVPHIIAVVFPDDDVYRFAAVLTPNCQAIAPPQVVDVEYIPLGSTRGSLRALGVGDNLYVNGSFPGPVEIFDLDAGLPYNPQTYELTLPTGVKAWVDEDGGLLRIIDTTGDVIFFSDDGAEHSNGPAVSYLRDGENRISEITDTLNQDRVYTYDTDGNLETFTNEANETTTFIYDDDHFLTKIIDHLGREILAADYEDDSERLREICPGDRGCWQMDHQIVGRTEIVTDPDGVVMTYLYDDYGDIVSVTNSLGHEWSVEYNDIGIPTKVTDPLGNVKSYTYDDNGFVSKIVDPHRPGDDPEDFTYRFEHTPQGFIKNLTSPSGGELQMAHDSVGHLLSMTDGEGNVIIEMGYDADYNWVSESDGGRTVTWSDFDAFGNPRHEDSNGEITTSSFDGGGRLQSYTSGGQTTSFTYDARGRERTVDDGNRIIEYGYGLGEDWTSVTGSQPIEKELSLSGRLLRYKVGDLEKRFTYTPGGRLRRIDGPDPGQWVEYTYDEVGRRRTETRSTGVSFAMTYDDAGRLLTMTNALDHTSSKTYRPDGQVESYTNARNKTWTFDRTPTSLTVTDPLNRSVTRTFSPYGVPLRETYGDGTYYEITYQRAHPMDDVIRYPLSIRDPGGRTKRFEYDASQTLLTKIFNTDNGLYQLGYDAMDRVETITDPINEELRYTYDDRGNVRFRTWGGTFTREAVYDLDDQVEKLIMPSSRTIDFERDAQFRVTQRTASSGEVETLAWGDNGLEGYSEPGGQATIQSDTVGNLERVDRPSGAWIEFERDVLERVEKIHTKSPNGAVRTTSYGYDEVGNLIRITDPLSGETIMEYNDVNSLVRRELPNGVVSTFDYDEHDQIIDVVHRDAADQILASVHYDRLPGGEPWKITEEDGTYVVLSYDDALRLLSEEYFDAADVSVGLVTYSYDLAGNRQVRTVDGAAESYAYLSGHRLDAITGANPAQFTIDDDGRMTGRVGAESWSYAYDYRDRLTSVSRNGQTLASYSYDALDQRIAASDGASTRHFLQAPVSGSLSNPYLVYDAAGNDVAGFVYSGAEPILRFINGEPVYYLTDGRGSVIGLAGSAGEGLARFRYDSFGNLRDAQGTDTDAPVELAGDFRFHGEWLEEATGLYHFRARDYAPELGRFLSRDPIEADPYNPEENHPYVFNANNPHVFSDPAGTATTANLTTTAGVQQTLAGIQTSFLKSLLRKLVREAKEAGVEKIKDFLIDQFVQAVIDNKAGVAPFIKDHVDWKKFESGVQDVMCAGQGDNGDSWFPVEIYFEPKIDEDGKPFADGFSCSQIGTEAEGQATKGTYHKKKGKKVLGPRPDFLMSNKKPTDMKNPIPFQSWLIGDVKKTVAHAHHTWSHEQVGQFKAVKNHSIKFGTSNVLVITANGGRKQKCKDLKKMFRPSNLTIWSLTGAFGKRKSKC